MATKPPQETTFRSYTSTQAASYAAGRSTYPDELIKIVLDHHASTGGKFTTLLDVGCGPANSTRGLSPYFRNVTGADPSPEMINYARTVPSVTATEGQPIRFEIGLCEHLDEVPGLQPGSVDLITAATAAHWFDMSLFWPQCAKMLKPDGTVALWTSCSWYCNPWATPNAKEVQAVLDELETVTLAPYETPGNRLNRGMYRGIGLPWTVEPPVSEISKKEFVRKEWNVNGQVGKGEKFFRGNERVTLEQFARGCGTASMVTRWREANPSLVGTEEDVVNVATRKIREAMGGQEWFEGGSETALLMFKKRE